MSKGIRVTDGSKFTRHYKTIKYDESADILRKGETVFFESTKDQPLKRQTMWKAAKKLSGMVGKKVTAVYGSIKLNGDVTEMQGYLFTVEETKKPS